MAFAVDMEKVNKARVRLQEESNRNKGDFQRAVYWKCSVGENNVRLMPPWTDEGVHAGEFWFENYTHWVNLLPYQCLTKHPDLSSGNSCLICQEIVKLRATRDPVDTELANSMRAKLVYEVNLVDLEDPVWINKDVKAWQAESKDSKRECPFKAGNTKVQLGSFKADMFKPIFTLFTKGIDVTSMENGRNIIITREGKGKFDTSYQVQSDPIGNSPFEFVGNMDKDLIKLDSHRPPYDAARVQLALKAAVGDSSPSLPEPKFSAKTETGKLSAKSSVKEVEPSNGSNGEEEDESVEDLEKRLRKAINSKK